jgi:hypothetical protein
MRGSQIAVQSQGALAMGHGQLGALGEPKHEAQDECVKALSGAKESALEAVAPAVAKYAALSSVPPHAATSRARFEPQRSYEASPQRGSRYRASRTDLAYYVWVCKLRHPHSLQCVEGDQAEVQK